MDRRAPTAAFTLEGYTPRQVAERLGQEGIFVWDLATTPWPSPNGWVSRRAAAWCYNTAAEVDRLLSEVSGLARG
jgi:selenocysteine lyase/cysteine desulfurase